MRSLFLILALSLGSCVTTQVKDKTLLPAIESAWDGVRDDIIYGGEIATVVDEWSLMVETNTLDDMDTQDVEDAAIVGVDLRLADGLVGTVGAEIMRDRARNFKIAVDEYVSSWVVYDAAPSDHLLVISRSSWAANPPSAIAGEVYR